MVSNEDAIKEARAAITPALEYFLSDCLLNKDCDECTDQLTNEAKNEFQQYLIGGALYNINPKVSYKLHKSAFEKRPNELNFNLEYAIESHRIGDYETAIKHYELFKKEHEEDYRIDVWLSECYLNIDNYSKSIEHWKKADHAKNHTGIDNAIYLVHGRTDQIKKRSDLINKVKTKDAKSAYELIFLDLNWEIDWWNSNTQQYFLEKDLLTIKEVFGASSTEYLQLTAYNNIKRRSTKANHSDSIKQILLESKMILDNHELPANGKVASELLRISFVQQLLNEKEFFEKRGQELIELADLHKDEELLNIYAYLESVATGHVSESTDKKGWNEYASERFAMSYFIGLADKNTYDNPDLNKAIVDFPNSSQIHWVKLNCAKIAGLEIKPDLIAVMKKEFKTLASDRNNYSYALRNYFYLLESEM